MNLKEYIKKNGIKGTHFAKKVGCSAQHLSLMMNGHQGPSLKLAFDIEEQTKGVVDVYSWKSIIKNRGKETKTLASMLKSDPCDES